MSRISDLAEKILSARTAYYNTDNPLVSDQVFDAWIDELKTLDPNNKAITMIGAPIVPSEWKKAKHQIPMGSLDKVNTPAEMSKWLADVAPNDEKLLITEKLDGLSIEVIYENGTLVQAITRGSDGIEGEDITSNVVRMAGVKSQLPDQSFTGSLRGEIIMRKSIHKQFFADKANPRNAATGTSKRLDGVGSDKLDILFYQAIGEGDVEFDTEQLQFVWLVNQGLQTPNWCIVKNDKQVNEYWRTYQDTERDKLDYEIDGLVVRLDNLAIQQALGDKDLRPKGARAFKFDNEARESIIQDIIWQVGNSGRITPVAIIDPVQLVGATITRASLYNLAYIEELGISVGAKVLVVRANDVIPRVEEVITPSKLLFSRCVYCPVCNTELVEIGEYIQCPNSATCPAQIVGRIKNWVKELNLLEWGDTLVEKLVESRKTTTVADLYLLTVDDLADLDRMGQKSAQKCYDILHTNKTISLEVFLGGLSIPMIGQSTIKLIMDAGCDNLTKFGQLTANEFEKVPGVGPVKAGLLAQGLIDNQKLILHLLECGVQIKDRVVGKLSGTSICFTGAMKNKRPVLEKMAADAGSNVKSSVGKGLTYLVIADTSSTSSKAVSARKLGTTLVSEEDFLEMVK